MTETNMAGSSRNDRRQDNCISIQLFKSSVASLFFATIENDYYSPRKSIPKDTRMKKATWKI